jgi:hypothetical protein
MTPALIATLRAAGDAATPGAWSDVQRSADGGHQVDSCVTGDCIVDTVFGSDEDAAFIVLARNHWGELLDEIERLRKVAATARDLLIRYESCTLHPWPGTSECIHALDEVSRWHDLTEVSRD